MNKYFEYVITNIEPLRIADESKSQNGQTVTLKYITGTAIRGLVINSIAGASNFESIKPDLFSDKVKYMNAYLYNDRDLIASPKGFYEDKTDSDGRKNIENVVIDGEFANDGLKRASLGEFCYIEDGCIYYSSADTDSDMRIRIKSDDMYRNEYVVPGYKYKGYVSIDDSLEGYGDIVDYINGVFKKDSIIMIGNGRSQGMGKCKVLSFNEIDNLPYYEYCAKATQPKDCYMMFISNGVMRDDNGEYCGIDVKKLEKLMGVSNLEISFCSSSTIDVNGYNRKWGTRTPSITMYEKGSVFHLKYDGEFTKDRIDSIVDNGIGVNKNEGCGRVIVFDKTFYENISGKSEVLISPSVEKNRSYDDEPTLKTAARNYYRILIEKGMMERVVNESDSYNIPSSQAGKTRAIIEKNKYNSINDVKKELEALYAHDASKEEDIRVHKAKTSNKSFVNTIVRLLDTDINEYAGGVTEIMGYGVNDLLDDAEIGTRKMQYILDMMSYDNRMSKEG